MEFQNNTSKSVLITIKRSLSVAKAGFKLLERKRNFLMRELTNLIKNIRKIAERIGTIYSRAYGALRKSNIYFGVCKELALVIPEGEDLEYYFKSVMGTEMPVLSYKSKATEIAPFGFFSSNSNIDEAYLGFNEGKEFIVRFIEIRCEIIRVAREFKKVRKRTSILENVVIPGFEKEIKRISLALEERDREEFARLKMLKKKTT
jgi:V/A-type H+-transporting ATPase subunit D